MQDYIQEIKGLPLFVGIKEADLTAMLTCIGGYVRSYKKGSFIFLLDEPIKCVGVTLDGVIHMIKEDIWGNKTTLAYIKQKELFGETFACGNSPSSTVSFYVACDCKVLFLPFRKVLHACNMSCVFHHRLIENMVTLIADKNVQLMEKIEISSRKSLREKILTYLSIQASHQQCSSFEIPIGRVELADYLCANRSALTRELNSMRTDGLLDFKRNTFHLL